MANKERDNYQIPIEDLAEYLCENLAPQNSLQEPFANHPETENQRECSLGGLCISDSTIPYECSRTSNVF